MSEEICEYIPTLPSPFSAGSLSAVLLAGLTLSGQWNPDASAHIDRIHVSGQEHRLVYSHDALTVVPEQDVDTLKTFSAFSLGIAKASADIPGYFFDVLEEDFESFLA